MRFYLDLLLCCVLFATLAVAPADAATAPPALLAAPTQAAAPAETPAWVGSVLVQPPLPAAAAAPPRAPEQPALAPADAPRPQVTAPQITPRAAQKSGLSDEFIANNEQRVRNGFMQNLAASAAYSSGFFSSQYLPLSESIFISEAQVIRDIAAKESAVIVGRCADYILAGRDNTINVFVYAPRETRVNRIMARRNLSEAEALKAITTSDKERGNHYFRYTDQKWGKAQNYDICINSALMGIEKTAEMLTAMAKIEVRA